MNHAWTHPATHRYVCKHCGLEKRNLAVKRWQQYTGQTAILESTGDPFPG